MKQYKYLQLTNSLLLLSLLFFILYSKKNTTEILLGVCLALSFVLSQLFWNNPKKSSMIHNLDSYIAKFTIFYFIIYTLLYKNLQNNLLLLYSYLLIMCSMMYHFYLSNYYSSKKWCCTNHIYHHCIAHINCFIGSLYAFY
jgi:hypothetical protein